MGHTKMFDRRIFIYNILLTITHYLTNYTINKKLQKNLNLPKPKMAEFEI